MQKNLKFFWWRRTAATKDQNREVALFQTNGAELWSVEPAFSFVVFLVCSSEATQAKRLSSCWKNGQTECPQLLSLDSPRLDWALWLVRSVVGLSDFILHW
jgi:hypothetical protein